MLAGGSEDPKSAGTCAAAQISALSADNATLRRLAQPRHKSAARVLFAGLVGGDWRGAAAVLRCRLSEDELEDLALVLGAALGRAGPEWPSDPAWMRTFAEAAAETRRDAARRARMQAEVPA